MSNSEASFEADQTLHSTKSISIVFFPYPHLYRFLQEACSVTPFCGMPYLSRTSQAIYKATLGVKFTNATFDSAVRRLNAFCVDHAQVRRGIQGC